jgi:hypothetical protein
LLDPSVVVLVHEVPPRLLLVERLVLVEILAEARAVAAFSLVVADKPTLVLTFDGENADARFIADPRFNPEWWRDLK